MHKKLNWRVGGTVVSVQSHPTRQHYRCLIDQFRNEQIPARRRKENLKHDSRVTEVNNVYTYGGSAVNQRRRNETLLGRCGYGRVTQNPGQYRQVEVGIN